MRSVTRHAKVLALGLLLPVLLSSSASPAAAQLSGLEYSLALQELASASLSIDPDPQSSSASPLLLAAWTGSMASAVPTYGDPRLGLSYRSTAAETPASGYQGGGGAFGTTSNLPTGIPTPSFGNMFFKGWVVITGVEFALLGICAALPRSFTGWSDNMVDEALDNLAVAYTEPPVWDDDDWAINYIGHPYGGAVYYNTVRCQGASFLQSFLFSTALSFQWEYIIEAVAEPPSTQDLLFTSTTGALLGEAIHITTNHMKRNGTNIFEKAFILVFNPTSVLFTGFN